MNKYNPIKVEYHANENPLKKSENNSICWSKVNVSNYQKTITMPVLGFYIENILLKLQIPLQDYSF